MAERLFHSAPDSFSFFLSSQPSTEYVIRAGKRVATVAQSTNQSLTALVAAASAYKGSWKNIQLAQDVKMFLWARYDSGDDLVYPTINNWDDLLKVTMDSNSYDTLTKDEVLSILFGLNHRNRIVEGLWWSMFERGVTQKLLGQLLALDTE